MSFYAGDLFTWAFVTNIINLLKKVFWVDVAQFFIFDTWKLKIMKIFKYEELKSIVMWDKQTRLV